jgi:hypothetical protein
MRGCAAASNGRLRHVGLALASAIRMRFKFGSVAVLGLVLMWGDVAHAAVVHVPIATRVNLKPGEALPITLETTEPTEIGWEAVQAKRCTMNCVQATEMSGGNTFSIATPLGASKKYNPTDGRISIEYKNMSSDLVTINVFRIARTCEAEACRFTGVATKGQWLVFKVDEFKSITTSKDESYSVISGVAIGGRPFTFTAVWWTDEKPRFGVNCAPFVKDYLERHVPTVKYSPYVISGQRVGDSDRIVLRSIDTCAPRSSKFGAPERNVFK